MALKDLFRRKPPTLASTVNAITIEKMGAAWEAVRGDPKHTDMVFSFALMAGAGDFARTSLPHFGKFLRHQNADVIAFEALAFNWFAIRASYPRPHNQNEALLDEGFRLGGMACLDVANARVGEACAGVFAPRVFEYRDIAKKSGFEAAVSHFTQILFLSDGAKLPQSVYRKSLTPYALEVSLANVGVLLFATTVPGGIAESLNLYLEDTELLNKNWPAFDS